MTGAAAATGIGAGAGGGNGAGAGGAGAGAHAVASARPHRRIRHDTRGVLEPPPSFTFSKLAAFT